MTSLIATRAPGIMCSGQAGEATTVAVKIQIDETNEINTRTYGMVVYGFSIVEAGNTAVTASIGKNLFVYATNEAPVQITLRGVIGEITSDKSKPKRRRRRDEQSDASEVKKFPKFYEDNRVGNKGKILKIIIDDTSYYAVLTSYNRNYSTTPSVTDDVSLSFLAVREEATTEGTV